LNLTMTFDTLLDTLASSRYAQLRTYRRDGRPVDTPMWFHLDGDTLVFRTKVGPKTRRLTADPGVELWPCDYRGRYPDGTPTISGQASILSGAAADAANRALQQRYGWQYNVVPLLKVPGVKNVHGVLPLPEKLRRATTKTIWPDSAIVEVKLTRSDARTAAPETVSAPDDSPRRG
jgi:PPOX class probable F420-dependent enzyme